MTSDPDRSPAILSYGFRPFFLLAGLYALAAIGAWIAWLYLQSEGAAPASAMAPRHWHGHELIFGYGVAAVSGFLLTAVPGWTGARRVAGGSLLLLVATWLLGRGAMWAAAVLPAWLVAAAEMIHLPLLSVFVLRGLMIRPAPRSMIFLGMLVLLILADGAVHGEWLGLLESGAAEGLKVGLLGLVLMVVIVGGRVVPAFTRNALMRQGEGTRLPTSRAWVDKLSIASVLAVIVATALDLSGGVVGGLALIAAAANALRMTGWRLSATLREPILWSLQLGYLWVPLGFAALAIAHLGGPVSETGGMHLLGAGAVGGMTLAIMTRAALGHTGRPLTVKPVIGWAYLMLAGSALARGLGPSLAPSHYFLWVYGAAVLWIAAFAIFVVVYLPILTGPPLEPDQN